MISQIDTRGFLFVRQPGSAVGKTIFCCIHMNILGTRKPFIDHGHKMTEPDPMILFYFSVLPKVLL